MRGAGERPAVVLRQQVGDELLAAREHRGASTNGRLRSRSCASASSSRRTPVREPLEAVGDDVRETPVARLMAQEHLEDVAELRVAMPSTAPGPEVLEQLPKQLLWRLAVGLIQLTDRSLAAAEPLPHQRRLADARRAAQEQASECSC